MFSISSVWPNKQSLNECRSSDAASKGIGHICTTVTSMQGQQMAVDKVNQAGGSGAVKDAATDPNSKLACKQSIPQVMSRDSSFHKQE